MIFFIFILIFLKKIMLTFFFALSSAYLFAQTPLLFTVNIDATQVQGDKQIIQNMKDGITRYLNQTQWTTDQFEANERIKCFIQIIITKRDLDNFTATANIRFVRPTYNSTYESVVINLSDKYFNFTYIPFQELQYTENSYNDNLTALLNFYAFMVLGLDYDSFSASGGMTYFQKAQEIATLAAANGGEDSWRSNSNPTSGRHWLVENMMNSSYKSFHTFMYKYYREGLDKMESDPAKGRKAILESMKEVQKLNKQNTLLRCVRMIFDAKTDELISVFTKGVTNDKNEFLQIVQEIDPLNMSNYAKIMESK
jgi:hypothetical protein